MNIKLLHLLLVALSAGGAMSAVLAETPGWQVVHAGSGESVQIDLAGIARESGAIAIARSRVHLGRSVNDIAGGYDSIQATTRYDCAGRSYTTLKRGYFMGDALVREEPVVRRRANPVLPGSLDDRMLALACKVGQSAQTAQTAAAGHSGTQPGTMDGAEPKAMHADMRALEEGTVAKAFPVSESAGGDKPRLIQLPAIDKAALAKEAEAQAAAAQALKSARQLAPHAKEDPSARAASVPRDTTHTKAGTAVATKTTSARKVEPLGDEAATERRLRELQYANSGPQRSTRRKKTEAPAVAPTHAPAAQSHEHWSYEGGAGPSHWAAMRPDFATCGSGKRQSPIDIRDGIRVNLEDIRFDYQPMRFRIIDNGHTVQVNVGDGSSLRVMGRRFMLKQFHFHRPSEERVDGRAYDMSVHLVHRDEEGQLAVLAVLLENGTEHPLIQTVLNNLPLERDVEMAPEDAIDPNKLLPENRAYWTYMGSLTTPPCTEGVLWMVMKQPLQVASDQVAIFTRVFGRNARPVQPMNGRLIKETR